MFRQVTALFFLLVFAMQTYSAPFIMLDYYANTGAYAKNCVNKARPKLHCNGKCQMMKKLQQEEKKDQQNPDRKGEPKAEVLSSKSFFCTNIQPMVAAIVSPTILPAQQPVVDRSFSFFHPPRG